MRVTLLAVMGIAATLSGCTKQDQVQTPSAEAAQKLPEATSWRSVATEQDRGRLRGWYKSWQDALSDARANGYGAKVDAEGALLVPTAALDKPELPTGLYRCRTLKLGAKGRSTLSFVAYEPFQCRVDEVGTDKVFYKLTGSQRPSGRIFSDGYEREVFLGTLALGDEQTAISYGSDTMRDMAGILERIGEKKWRMVLPNPAYESLLDVIELIPENRR